MLPSDKHTKKILQEIEDWYVQNGSATHPDLISINDTSTHTVSYGGDHIEGVPGTVIPLLVAVKLGFSTRSLREIILHYGIHPFHFEAMDFTSSGDLSDFALQRDDGTLCTKVDFLAQVFQGMEGIYSHRSELKDLADKKAIFRIALMHTDIEEAWSSTIIKQRSVDACMDTEEFLVVPEKEYYFTVGSIVDKNSLPNRNIMDFLTRSGALVKDASRRVIAHHAIWEELADEALRGNTTCVEILSFCAKHKSPEFQMAVRTGLLGLAEWEFMDDANYHDYMKNMFSTPAYRDIFEKKIPKLNLVSTDTDDFEAAISNSPFSSDFANRENLLNDIAQEIMSLRPQDIGYQQLTVFNRLVRMELPPQIIKDKAPEAFVNYCLDAIDGYVAKRPINDGLKRALDADVLRGLANLLMVIRLNHEIDHSAFADRSSRHKKMLVNAGLDIHKMNGINLSDQKDIFVTQLGI